MSNNSFVFVVSLIVATICLVAAFFNLAIDRFAIPKFNGTSL